MAQRAALNPKRRSKAQPGGLKVGGRAQQQPAAAAVSHDAMKQPSAPGPEPAQQPTSGAAVPAAHAAPEAQPQPSSRLCIKNLPKYVTEAKLREHFSAKGEVTDVKVARTRQGTSRQMGFVGFKTVQDAAAALKYFDRTFIDATRINVEYARTFKDPGLARPWSKHSEGSSAHAKTVDGTASEAAALAARLAARKGDAVRKAPGRLLGGLEADDPQLAEFLSLMAPRSRAKLWANDELAPQQTLQDLLATKGGAGSDGEDGGAGSSDDEYQDVGATMHGSAGRGSRGRAGSQQRMPLPGGVGASESDDDEAATAGRGLVDGAVASDDADGGSDDDDEGEGAARADPLVTQEGVSDMEYLKSRMRTWNDDDSADDEMEEDVADRAPSGGALHPSKPSAQVAAPTAGDAGPMQVQPHSNEEMVDGGTTAGGDAAAAVPAQGAAGGRSMHAPIADPDAAVRATSRLFIRNLAYTATEADLLALAGEHGDVQSVHLVMDRDTRTSKGIAYVQFVLPDAAVAAYHALDGQIFQGRLLHVLPAKAQPSGVVAVEEGGAEHQAPRSVAGSSFKAEQEARRKADAGNRSAWNSLFMRPDTVQDAVAAHYGVSKAELLDARAGGDVAVRVALGEAAVIQQTKAALSEQGVNVESLEAAAAAGGRAAATGRSIKRSPTALLIKNLPYSSTEEELMDLLSRSGPVARLVLPPTHTLALVEYCEPQDARAAFKALAFKKFHHVPLYLEWAPHDVFSTAPPPKAAAAAAVDEAVPGSAQTAAGAPAPAPKETVTTALGGGDEGEEGGSTACTIYVKNLAFTTTDAALKKHFDKVVSAEGGVLHSARVSKRQHPTTGQLLSAGYGFVEVDSPEVAAAVIKKLQASLLDHYKLSLQLSKGKGPGAAAGGPGAASRTAQAQPAKPAAGAGQGAKLVVRNVAFEATRKDMVALFSPFGHLKSCRLPKKFDGSHRGFAFVEFVTKQEARNAVDGVTGTHLYGRRLVVEYAKEEEGLDELRAKTGVKYRSDEEAAAIAPAAKRLKKSL